MTILHLTTFLQGGAGRVLVDLATDQRARGHDVAVVTSRTDVPGYGNYPDYLKQLRRAHVAVETVDSTFARDPPSNLAVVRALERRYGPGAEPDVIHSHAATPSLVALIFSGARRARTALVQTMHGWGVSKTAAQIDADRTVLSLVDVVAVPSRHALAQMESLGVPSAQLRVVPYGIGPSRVVPDAGDLKLIETMGRARSDGALVVVCVGTIGPRKNQVLLVRSLAHLRVLADAPRIFAAFVGDGDADGLRRDAADAGVSAAVHIHGYSRAARAIAAAADALVLPSRNEGQPLAVLEAFADGTLAIVSDIPELVEVVEDGVTGVTFAAESATSLAEALAKVASLPEGERRALRACAAERHVARFSTSAMADRYADLYGAIARRRLVEPETALAAS